MPNSFKAALALAMVVAIFSSLLLTRPATAAWLEAATGETDLRQQLEGFVLSLRTRDLFTADLAPVSHAGVAPYGANTFFEQEVEEWKVRKSMEMLRDAEIRWVRQQVPWAQIEKDGKGRFVDAQGSSWQQSDRFIALAREYGLEVVARLDLPPQWARVESKTAAARPRNMKDYGDFVYEFVKRHRGQVRYIQLWNEPNLYDEWGETPDARAYVELLKEGYLRAKEANPEVVVISAALAPTVGTPDGKNESDLTFLQKMYDTGAANYFDILSAQMYGLWSGPGNRRVEPDQINFSRVRMVRDIMVKNGDAGKPIWVSETGWSALPVDFPGPAPHGRVDEERQARYTVAAYQRAQEEWPWIGVVFYWHFRRVSEEDRKDVNFYFRMVDPDFTPQPVYYAYKSMAAEPPVLHYGRHQEDHWALRYRGNWRRVEAKEAELGGVMVSKTAGDSLEFTFKGSPLSLLTETGPGAGSFCVELDGAPAEQARGFQNRGGKSCINLKTEQTSRRAEVTLGGGLAEGEHSLRLEVVGDGEVSVDALSVNRRETQRGQLAVGLLLIMAAVATLWVGLRRAGFG